MNTPQPKSSRVKGYGKYYSAGSEIIPVVILGKSTLITNFIKDGRSLMSVFCILNSKSEWINLDIKNIPNVSRYNMEVIMKDGLPRLADYIKDHQEDFKHLL